MFAREKAGTTSGGCTRSRLVRPFFAGTDSSLGPSYSKRRLHSHAGTITIRVPALYDRMKARTTDHGEMAPGFRPKFVFRLQHFLPGDQYRWNFAAHPSGAVGSIRNRRWGLHRLGNLRQAGFRDQDMRQAVTSGVAINLIHQAGSLISAPTADQSSGVNSIGRVSQGTKQGRLWAGALRRHQDSQGRISLRSGWDKRPSRST